MSLVELALKKMQAARASAEDKQSGANAAKVARPQSRLAEGVIGEVVVHGSHRRIDGAEGPLPPNHGKMVRIDQAALRLAGLAPPEHQQRQIADQYRHVKRPLIGAATGRGVPKVERGQLIMMASAMSGEGKTFTSINLALSMALEKDVHVLLVDADVAKPHISRILGVDREPGLMDVLRDPALNIESVILPTDVPNLSVLPAGQRSETATELLASQRMEETVEYLARSDASRIVLIDSPPLLLTSESRALAQCVGQVVIVVRADITPQQAVLDAISKVGENKSISLVLNQSKVTTSTYYGYGDASHVPVA
jgi:protein-tyrosine kinase